MKWDYFMVWLASRAKSRIKGVRHHPMDECLNCQEKLEKEQFFCSNCGQKVHNSKLTVWSLIAEFFSSIFNIDNGVYRSLKCLAIPGFLSRQFMGGKRKRYLNPIRFFLIALIIHIAVITDIIPIEEVNRMTAKNLEEIGQKKLHAEFYQIKDSMMLLYPNCDLDSIEMSVFHNMEFQNDSLILEQMPGRFSMNSTIDINDNQIDTTKKPKFNGGPNIQLPFLTKSYRLYIGDVYDMPIDAFLTKYKAENYWERVFLTQLVRTLRDPSGAIKFGIGNIIWSVVSSILLIALLMKLLYIRRNRYYVEHLIVLFNVHSFAFLLASIALYVAVAIQGGDSFYDDVAYGIIFIYFFLSIKFYYRQGWFKSFIKFVIIGWTYLILLIAMIAMVTIISLFFFK